MTDDWGLPSAVLGKTASACGILPWGGGAQVGKGWQMPPELYARQDATPTGRLVFAPLIAAILLSSAGH